MKISKIESFSDLEIINIILTLVTDHIMFTKNWIELMFNKELLIPPEIKNRIFCIWFSAAIDTIVEEQDQYLPLLGQIKKRKLNSCFFLMEQFRNLVESIKRRIRLIDEEKQIIIIHYRNTLVHGRVFSTFRKKNVNLNYLCKSTDKIIKFKGGSDEFWKIFRNNVKDSLDEFLMPLRKTFFDESSEYYRTIIKMSKPETFQLFRKIAYQNIKP